ncbi:hypothetical protein [Amnibacterium sp.]|uniref:hypothetical protein n=1 Tax=Amnibacterium sp. TaxID=1872496 RepID=UPI0026197D00|nr:hypothetical protein [Amnibacterium sp.]MCU1474052.1 hypothetical protein [Amnibacterium sp.]
MHALHAHPAVAGMHAGPRMPHGLTTVLVACLACGSVTLAAVELAHAPVPVAVKAPAPFPHPRMGVVPMPPPQPITAGAASGPLLARH